MNTIGHFYIMHSDIIYDEECNLEKATKLVLGYWDTLPLEEKYRVNQCFFTFKKYGVSTSYEWDVEAWKHALAVEDRLKEYIGDFGNVAILKHDPSRIMIDCKENSRKLKGLLYIITSCGYKTSIQFILGKIFVRVY